MIEGSDYTSTDGSTFVILNGGVISGDVIEGVAYKAFNAATATIGISSAGTPISTQANTLNFVGTGNTFALRGTTIDVSISGGGAGAGGTWSNYDSNAGVTTTKKVKIQNNLEVTGVTTSTGGFVGAVTGNASGTAGGLTGTPDITVRNIIGVAATFTGVLTYEDVTNVDSVGIVTARGGFEIGASGVGGTITSVGNAEFVGFVTAKSGLRVPGGAGVANRIELGNSQEFTVQYNTSSTRGLISAASNSIDIQATTIKLLPNVGENGVIANQNGSVDLYHDNVLKLSTAGTGVTITGICSASGGVQIGAGQSFGANGPTAVYYGDGSNLTGISVGLTTAAGTAAGIVTTLFLSSAQDHKITASGITTITCSGGTEADSHTVRIINSGITTVGFSTFFLFPSGSAPSLPTADGAISLISFTVNRVGAGGTQLLAGASVNFS